MLLRKPVFWIGLLVIATALLVRLFVVDTYYTHSKTAPKGLPAGRLFFVARKGNIAVGDFLIYQTPAGEYALSQCIALPGSAFHNYPAPKQGETITADSLHLKAFANLLMQEAQTITTDSLAKALQKSPKLTIQHSYYLCVTRTPNVTPLDTVSYSDIVWVRNSAVCGKLLAWMRHPF